MPKSEREELVNSLTTSIFALMLDDVLFDVALEAHHKAVRASAQCMVCKTNCNGVHEPLSLAATVAQRGSTPSRASTPVTGDRSESSGSPSKSDGNLYFPCVNCQRPIASSRFAQHLSSCLNGRRAARPGMKSKPSSEDGRSGSPFSESGDLSDTSPSKRSRSQIDDEADFNLKRKRPDSPQTPNKKQKQVGKLSGSPVQRLKSSQDIATDIPSNAVSNSTAGSTQSKVPSKLRDSPINMDFMEGSLSPASNSSSPGPDSSFSVVSPALPNGRTHHENQSSEFNIDLGGVSDETGSSTDSESD
ncbi:hypothetical protein DL96DRAFT_1574142 [Flagelloscypha sp. PMI_526]|nr:hypothetical protein DL96DRAFT_1574142 [Flagelloscypha sp. PMI_526]